MAYTPPQSDSSISLATKIVLGALFIIVLVFSLALAGVTFYYIPQEKSKLKDLTDEQVRNLTELEQKYSTILTTIKETAPPEEIGETELLGVQDSREATNAAVNRVPMLQRDSGSWQHTEQKNVIEIKPEVLGLEESFEITQARKLTELYGQGKKTVRKIDKLNTEVKYKSEFSYVHFTLPSSRALTAKTEQFADNTLALLTYLEESNKLGIELFTFGYEFGLTLNDAILREADETAINNLDRKINEIDTLKQKYISLDTSRLSGDLRAQHIDELQEFDRTKQVFNRLATSLQNKDAEDLIVNLQSLLLEAAAASESGKVVTVSFWQNNATIRAVQDLKSEWQAYNNKL